VTGGIVTPNSTRVVHVAVGGVVGKMGMALRIDALGLNV
jgi:hypothetical protein